MACSVEQRHPVSRIGRDERAVRAEPDPAGVGARRAALQMLDSVLRKGTTLDSAARQSRGLAPNDQALAIAIAGERARGHLEGGDEPIVLPKLNPRANRAGGRKLVDGDGEGTVRCEREVGDVEGPQERVGDGAQRASSRISRQPSMSSPSASNDVVPSPVETSIWSRNTPIPWKPQSVA